MYLKRQTLSVKKPGKAERRQLPGSRPLGSELCRSWVHATLALTLNMSEPEAPDRAGQVLRAELRGRTKQLRWLKSGKRKESQEADSWTHVCYFQSQAWKARPRVGQGSPEAPACCVCWVSSTYPQTFIWKASFFIPWKTKAWQAGNQLTGPSHKRTGGINLSPQVGIKDGPPSSTVTLMGTITFTLKSTSWSSTVFWNTSVAVMLEVVLLKKICLFLELRHSTLAWGELCFSDWVT